MSIRSSKQYLTGFKQHRAITLSDPVNLVEPMYIYCLTSGTAQVVDQDDVVVGYPMTAGQLLPLLAKRINSTSTTGTYAGLR
jgi:hypothetical protein